MPGTNDYVRRQPRRNRQPILRFDPSTYTTAEAEQAANPRRRRRTVAQMVEHMNNEKMPAIGRLLDRGRTTRVFLDYADPARPAMSTDKQRNAFSFEIPLPREWGDMEPDEQEDYVEQFIRTPTAQLLFDASEVSNSPINEQVQLHDESAWTMRHHESQYVPPSDSEEDDEEEEDEYGELSDHAKQLVDRYVDVYIDELESDRILGLRSPNRDATGGRAVILQRFQYDHGIQPRNVQMRILELAQDLLQEYWDDPPTYRARQLVSTRWKPRGRERRGRGRRG